MIEFLSKYYVLLSLDFVSYARCLIEFLFDKFTNSYNCFEHPLCVRLSIITLGKIKKKFDKTQWENKKYENTEEENQNQILIIKYCLGGSSDSAEARDIILHKSKPGSILSTPHCPAIQTRCDPWVLSQE